MCNVRDLDHKWQSSQIQGSVRDYSGDYLPLESFLNPGDHSLWILKCLCAFLLRFSVLSNYVSLPSFLDPTVSTSFCVLSLPSSLFHYPSSFWHELRHSVDSTLVVPYEAPHTLPSHASTRTRVRSSWQAKTCQWTSASKRLRHELNEWTWHGLDLCMHPFFFVSRRHQNETFVEAASIRSAQ